VQPGVQGVATLGCFLQSHHIITMNKSEDLAYGSTMMDLISCFRDIVGRERDTEIKGTLQMI